MKSSRRRCSLWHSLQRDEPGIPKGIPVYSSLKSGLTARFRGMSFMGRTLATLLVALCLGTYSFCQNPSAGSVTFAKDVAPILQKNCQTCHRPGEAAPFSLLTYEEARPWAASMKRAVRQKSMPPWFADPGYGHFSNDRSLTEKDINT